MKLEFTHKLDGYTAKATYTLVKHKKYRSLPDEEQRQTNWYMRVRTKDQDSLVSMKHANDADAIREARVYLDLHFGAGRDPNSYSGALAAVQRRASATLTSVLQDYLAAGTPDRDNQPRTGRSAYRATEHVRKLCAWPGSATPINGIKLRDVLKYHDWRRTSTTRRNATGGRSAEIEVVCASNALSWAVRTGLIDANPWAVRRGVEPRRKNIRHCHQSMPANADVAHRICAALMERPKQVSYGAQWLFQLLTGLRTGEPGFLRWDGEFKPGTNEQAPGVIWKQKRRSRDGHDEEVTWLAVRRTKGGMNPAVIITPVLAQFLQVWKQYAQTRWPNSPFMFPHPMHPERPVVEAGESDKSDMGKVLARICAHLHLPPVTPHSARGWYVAVRRSEGAYDDEIANELGECSGAMLIVRTYGRADQIRGLGNLTWMPSNTPVAWTCLTRGNIIGLPVLKAACP